MCIRMKQRIPLLILCIFFLSLISCQTTQLANSDLEEDSIGEDVDASAADAVGIDDVQEKSEVADDDVEIDDLVDEDLEEEFTDSEEFEKDLVSSEDSKTDDLEKESTGDSEEEQQSASATDESPVEDTAVTAADDSSIQPIDTKESVSEEESSAQTYSSEISVIQNIRYQANENKIYIEGKGTLSYQSRENISENQMIIEIPNAVLADHLKWPFVMKEFDTQMVFLKADQKENNVVRVVLQMRENAGSPSIAVAESGALVISAPIDDVAAGTDVAASTDSGDSMLQQASADDVQTDSYTSQPVLPAKSLEEFFYRNTKI